MGADVVATRACARGGADRGIRRWNPQSAAAQGRAGPAPENSRQRKRRVICPMSEPENIAVKHEETLAPAPAPSASPHALPASAQSHPASATGAPAPPDQEPEEPRFLFTPPIDIYETNDGLVLQADLPGVSIK